MIFKIHAVGLNGGRRKPVRAGFEVFPGGQHEHWRGPVRPAHGRSAVGHIHSLREASRGQSLSSYTIMRRAVLCHGIRSTDQPGNLCNLVCGSALASANKLRGWSIHASDDKVYDVHVLSSSTYRRMQSSRRFGSPCRFISSRSLAAEELHRRARLIAALANASESLWIMSSCTVRKPVFMPMPAIKAP